MFQLFLVALDYIISEMVRESLFAYCILEL